MRLRLNVRSRAVAHLYLRAADGTLTCIAVKNQPEAQARKVIKSRRAAQAIRVVKARAKSLNRKKVRRALRRTQPQASQITGSFFSTPQMPRQAAHFQGDFKETHDEHSSNCNWSGHDGSWYCSPPCCGRLQDISS